MADVPVFWVVVGIVLLVVFFPRLKARFGRRRRPRAASSIDVEADLLRHCRGDRAMAERLIHHEKQQDPELSRVGAALMALARLRDDNR